jgi:hypothetical protein
MKCRVCGAETNSDYWFCSECEGDDRSDKEHY